MLANYRIISNFHKGLICAFSACQERSAKIKASKYVVCIVTISKETGHVYSHLLKLKSRAWIFMKICTH